MKYFLLFLSVLVLISCSETAKVGCSDDSDCSDDRICESNSCITCKATMCNYDNASGVCEANQDGKIHCAMGVCSEGFWDIDKKEENGCEYSCVVTNNGVEVCDTKDNNCDGKIDEGLNCSCNENETNTCTITNTSCDGMQACVSGSWGECKTDDTTVGMEICDNIDNDCNDGVDEDFKTNGIYTDNDNCGACNQKCEASHGTNSCDLTGVCKPKCEQGWSNFDENGLNGCEAGCSLYNLGESKVNKVILSTDENYIVGDSDSDYKDGKILLTYTKSNEFASAIVAQIIDKNGVVIKNEVYLASTSGGEFSIKPKVVMKGDYNYILYRDDYKNDGSKKVKLLIKDSSLNLGNSLEISSVGTSADISKKNFISNKVFVVWSKKIPNLGGGSISNVYFRAYDELTGQLDAAHGIPDEQLLNLIAPKTTTSAGFGLPLTPYVAIAYCKQLPHTRSTLELYTSNVDFSQELVEAIDDFNNNDCGDFENTGSITSDSKNIYISYIKGLSLYIKKYAYGRTLNHNSYELSLIGSYKISASDDENIVNSVINYKDNNLLLTYTRYFITGSNGGLGLVNYGKTYQRLTNDLKLKDSQNLISSVGYDLNTNNMSILYTDDKEIVLQYENVIDSNSDIEIIRTSSCEN